MTIKTSTVDDEDDDTDAPQHERISCENCIFRNAYVHKETRGGHNKYLCRHSPPHIVVMGSNKPTSRTIPVRRSSSTKRLDRLEGLLEQILNKTVDSSTIPVVGIVRSFDWCGQWIDRETKESFETVMNIK